MTDQASPAVPEASGEGMSLDDIVARIAAKSEPQAPEPPADQPAAEDEPDATDEADTPEPTTDDGEGDEPEASQDEADDDTGETEDDPEADGPDDAEVDLDRKVKVKIDGKEHEVTLRELRDNYSFHSRNAREAQRIADERKAFDEERQTIEHERKAVRDERLYLSSLVNTVKGALVAHLPTPQQLEQLRVSNPQQYLLVKDEVERAQRFVAGLEHQARQTLERSAAETQAEIAQRLRRSAEELRKAIPELAEAGKGEAFARDVREVLRSAEYSDQEIGGISDHRVLKLLHRLITAERKAAELDRLKAKRPAVERRVAQAPRSAKPGVAVSADERARGRIQDIQKRAAKTGRVADVAALIAAKQRT